MSTNRNDPASPPPCVIVFGALRAGTTMLRLMLDHHPELSCEGETDFLIDFLVEDGDGLRYDLDALARDRIFRDSRLRPPSDPDGRAGLADMIGQLARRGGGRPVLMMHRRMELCAKLLPDAPILRLQRDPRDVSRSSIGMGWSGNAYNGATHWIRSERSWQAFETAHPDARTLKLRYEDLVAEPERRLIEVCDFLSIPYDPAMLSYPETTTYAAPDPALASQWKRKLSEHEIALLEGRIGDLLARSGYAPSGIPPVRPGPVEGLRLALQNRIGIWKVLLRRYGFFDPVMRGVGRRLHLQGLHRYALRRIEEKAIPFRK